MTVSMQRRLPDRGDSGQMIVVDNQNPGGAISENRQFRRQSSVS